MPAALIAAQIQKETRREERRGEQNMNALDAPFAHYEYSTFARRGRKQRATFTGKYRVDTRRTLSAEAGGWLSLTRHPPARKGTQAAHAGTRILIYYSSICTALRREECTSRLQRRAAGLQIAAAVRSISCGSRSPSRLLSSVGYRVSQLS